VLPQEGVNVRLVPKVGAIAWFSRGIGRKQFASHVFGDSLDTGSAALSPRS
jgi:hypothetical protein